MSDTTPTASTPATASAAAVRPSSLESDVTQDAETEVKEVEGDVGQVEAEAKEGNVTGVVETVEADVKKVEGEIKADVEKVEEDLHLHYAAPASATTGTTTETTEAQPTEAPPS
jgi:hypothetical protein